MKNMPFDSSASASVSFVAASQSTPTVGNVTQIQVLLLLWM